MFRTGRVRIWPGRRESDSDSGCSANGSTAAVGARANEGANGRNGVVVVGGERVGGEDGAGLMARALDAATGRSAVILAYALSPRRTYRTSPPSSCSAALSSSTSPHGVLYPFPPCPAVRPVRYARSKRAHTPTSADLPRKTLTPPRDMRAPHSSSASFDFRAPTHLHFRLSPAIRPRHPPPRTLAPAPNMVNSPINAAAPPARRFRPQVSTLTSNKFGPLFEIHHSATHQQKYPRGCAPKQHICKVHAVMPVLVIGEARQ